jgi:hypothetical protein
MDLRFKHPFTCIVSGPTKAGKTNFVKQLIENFKNFIDPPPKYIWWFYAEEQNFYKELKDDVIFIKGVPNFSIVRDHSQEPQLVIIDDLMHESNNEILFTRGCHHWNISVINIVQNIFYKGLRTSRINSEYLILMKNPSDRLQIQTLARQLYPHNMKYFLEAYADATVSPYSYLLVDLTQSTPDNFRLRAKIFSKHPVVYTEKL